MEQKQISPLLLDTHIWIWLNTGSTLLAPETIHCIETAATQGMVWIAAISVWELATLVRKQRISLTTSVQDWVQTALAQPGMQFAEMTPTIAIESTVLPGEIHGDPADRLIVATARHLRLTLVTRDAALLRYGEAGYVSVRAG
ncbi:MAG: twitching motility protein PilT [Gammaproteobacteria bacterium RIFCSPHIGHO2_12_FULL_45_9]|nr:MAG: twitching motility protein PilT [Gammaproteobacteria bacterium RIFCSPHIGHO2_12_FULL_45_9]